MCTQINDVFDGASSVDEAYSLTSFVLGAGMEDNIGNYLISEDINVLIDS